MAKPKTTDPLPLCACGCGQRVTQRRNKFFSHHCAQQASRKVRVIAAERLLDGTESFSDRLVRENTTLRNELKKSNAAIERFKAQTALDERLVNEVLGYLEANPYRPKLVKPKRQPATASDHEMLLVLSDAHFPEVVDPKQAMGLEYNPDICRKRLQYIVEKVVRYKDLRSTAYPVRKLTVACLGDMLGGTIHPELEITNAMPMSEALVEMAYMLYDAGAGFASNFPQVEFVVMPGNHARLTEKPRSKGKFDNWEHVMGQFLKALARDQFSVTVPKDLVYNHAVFDLKVGLTHGDGVKSNSFAGIPFYGMRNRRDAMQALMRQLDMPQIDMLILGHFHTLLYWPSSACDIFMNGSIKGGDEYSISRMYTASDAVQGLLTFHKNHGLTDISRIDLDHVK